MFFSRLYKFLILFPCAAVWATLLDGIFPDKKKFLPVPDGFHMNGDPAVQSLTIIA
jgi:hypothetical protein